MPRVLLSNSWFTGAMNSTAEFIAADGFSQFVHLSQSRQKAVLFDFLLLLACFTVTDYVWKSL